MYSIGSCTGNKRHWSGRRGYQVLRDIRAGLRSFRHGAGLSDCRCYRNACDLSSQAALSNWAAPCYPVPAISRLWLLYSDPGEEKSAEEGNSAQPPAAEDEEKKRAEHEAAEAQRKAEFDAKQQAKKAAEQEQIARLEAMSDEEVIAASTQRVSTDVEKLTRRNMKECVSEHIQMLCMEDTAFARLTMHPKKNMIRCFQYINRKAWDYVQDELKASGTRPGPGQQAYGCDVPDDLCYQWAEDYFRDPDAKEDHEDEEKFVPKPYAGKSSAKNKPKKAAEKKKTEPKSAPKQEEKKPSQDGQMSLLDFGMAKAG